MNKKNDGVPETKAFNVNLPIDVWMFLKTQSILQARTMNQIITELVLQYKKKIEKN